MAGTDRWARWLARDRHGGDEDARRRALELLAPIRDRVLTGARLNGSERLLDLGCGEGLIGFAALDALPGGHVVFSDFSSELVGRCREIAEGLGVVERCSFLVAGADDLAEVDDESIDVVTARSVLIYLDRDGKRRALAEAHRVLSRGGRLSLFEPINRFSFPEAEDRLLGYDVSPIRDVAAKVRAAMEGSADESTLMDFDERDLFDWAESAGFPRVNLTLEAERTNEPRTITDDWDTLLNTSGNPLSPTFGEIIAAALGPEEAARLEAHLRPLVQSGQGSSRFAGAYVTAVK